MKGVIPFCRLLVILLLLFAMPLYAINATSAHRGNITSLIHDGQTVISAGEDGLIVIWNVLEGTASQRFHLTPYAISSMVKHPQKEQICIVESAGMDDYRITVWDYESKSKLFSLRSMEKVTYINYSAGGSFIIASGFNGSSLTLLDSTTGENYFTNATEGNVTLAITGRTERNMLVYQSDFDYFAPVEHSGLIFYLDMDSFSITNSFRAPGNLLNPVIFGNNRFLAGINEDGLIIVDAATGAIYASMENIERNALLYSAGDGFYCLIQNEDETVLYRFTVNNRGNLVTETRDSISSEVPKISLFAYNEGAAFASGDSLLLLDGENITIAPSFSFQEKILGIAHTDNTIAFLTANSELGFLPLDYRLIRGMELTLEKKNGYSRITSLSKDEDKFLLWQNSNTQYLPQIVNTNHVYEKGLSLPGRFPLRSVSSKNNRILVLDSSGNSYLYNTDNPDERARLVFSSVGAIDASFVDGENFLLCRSVISGNSPFLYVNINTGETVPFLYDAQAGIVSYTGKSGSIYAASVQRDFEGLKTTVINLYASAGTRVRSGTSVKILEYIGEDARISIAESGSSLAVSCGEEAAIYGEAVIPFERTEGLPQILLGSDDFFICLDSEGSISWHDNETGNLLAVFRLYEDNWTLSNGTEISGSLSQP